MTYRELREFIVDDMQMSHVYQLVMLVFYEDTTPDRHDRLVQLHVLLRARLFLDWQRLLRACKAHGLSLWDCHVRWLQ